MLLLGFDPAMVSSYEPVRVSSILLSKLLCLAMIFILTNIKSRLFAEKFVPLCNAYSTQKVKEPKKEGRLLSDNCKIYCHSESLAYHHRYTVTRMQETTFALFLLVI